MRQRFKIATGAVGASALLLAGAPSAMAAGDTVAPQLKLPVSAQFVAGTQVGDSSGLFGARPQTYPIRQLVTWSATDAGGICGYDVFRVFAGAPPQQVVTNSMETAYADLTTDYDSQQGGGTFKVTGWKVVARDCAGNTASATTRVLPVVTQENNRTYGFKGVTIDYSTGWNTSTNTRLSGDRARWTATAGAQATITRTWAAGDQAALVMVTAPGRGALDVLVDGVRRATVDTFASTPRDRSVVWAAGMNAGVHTVTLVNLATAGHPRIDLDAVLSNSKFYCFC